MPRAIIGISPQLRRSCEVRVPVSGAGEAATVGLHDVTIAYRGEAYAKSSANSPSDTLQYAVLLRLGVACEALQFVELILTQPGSEPRGAGGDVVCRR